LVEEYKIQLNKEKLKELVDTAPSLDSLYKKCEETQRELKIEDPNFSIKLFLAVMFNLLRFYWVSKWQDEKEI